MGGHSQSPTDIHGFTNLLQRYASNTDPSECWQCTGDAQLDVCIDNNVR